MTTKEALEVIVNRGYENDIYDPSKWRMAIYVISKAYENGEITIHEKPTQFVVGADLSQGDDFCALT